MKAVISSLSINTYLVANLTVSKHCWNLPPVLQCMDCDSVVVCVARWSLMASGDGMVYSSGVCYGSLPVMVGWVAFSVAIANSTSTELQNTHQTFHARLYCFVFSFFFCVCTKHALPV